MTTRALGEVASLCGTLYQSRVNSRNRMETQWEPTGPGSLLPNNGDTGGARRRRLRAYCLPDLGMSRLT